MPSSAVAAADKPPEAAAAVVRADSYLTLHYRVSLVADAVDVVGTFGGRPATLQLGAGQLSPALEECLIGLEVGARETFALPPGQAFGPRNGDLVRRVPRALLEAESGRSDYSSGDAVEFNAPGGGRYAGVFRSFEGEDAIFDFNHPLAGHPVRFEVEILGIL
jgi:FKBP-type peptidyl-prolyl cis-trans isomerase SlpA